jgi:methyl-accepting chemotaxis protein
MVFKLAGGNSNIAATPVKRSNRAVVAKLPNRGPAAKKAAAHSSANSVTVPAQPRKVAAGGGDDWEEF